MAEGTQPGYRSPPALHPGSNGKPGGWSPGTPEPQRSGESPGPAGQQNHVKVNQNKVMLPEFTEKPDKSLQTFLNKVEIGARLGAWTPDYKMGQLYAQKTGGALQPEPERPKGRHTHPSPSC